MKVIVCVLGGKHCTLREGHACRQPVRISIKQVSLENKLVTMKPSFSQLVIKLTTIPVHLCSLSHFLCLTVPFPFSFHLYLDSQTFFSFAQPYTEQALFKLGHHQQRQWCYQRRNSSICFFPFHFFISSIEQQQPKGRFQYSRRLTKAVSPH